MKNKQRKIISFLLAMIFGFYSTQGPLFAEEFQHNPTQGVAPTVRPEDIETKLNESLIIPKETTTDFLMHENPLSKPEESQTNQKPVAASSARNVAAGQIMTSKLAATDGDRDNLAFELVEGPKQGELKIEKDGSYTYTSGNNYLGNDEFTYRVFDGKNYSEIAKVVLNITENPGERITHAISIQPIQVCDDEGKNCQNNSLNLYEEITAKIWQQAGIAFDYLPFVKYLDSTALQLSQINAMNLKPVWDYSYKILNLFFVETISGVRGLSDFDGLLSVISSLATPSTIAHEIGNNLGLADTSTFDPLNLMNSGKRDLEIPKINHEQFLQVFTFPRWLRLTAQADQKLSMTIDPEDFIRLTNVNLKGEKFTYAIAEAPQNEEIELYYQTIPYREGLWIKAKSGNLVDQFSYFAINEKGEKELITVDLKVSQGSTSDGVVKKSDKSLASLNLIPASGLKLLGDQENLILNGKNHFGIDHQDNFLLEEGAVSLWFNAEDPNTYQGILSKELVGQGEGEFSIVLSRGEVSVKFEDATRTYWVASDGKALRAQGKSDSPTITANTWHNVVVTFGKEGVYLYIDGKKQILRANYTGGLKGLSASGGNQAPMVIGAISAAINNSYVNHVSGIFSGDINNVTLFDRIPTPEEIQKMANQIPLNEKNRSFVETPRDGVMLLSSIQDFKTLKPQELPHQAIFDAKEKTLSFWLETDELSKTPQGLIAKDKDFNISLENDAIVVRLENENFSYDLRSGSVIEPHKKQFITIELGEKEMSLYVDGILISNKVFSKELLKNRNVKQQDSLLIGALWGYSSGKNKKIEYRHFRNSFKGKLGDIQLFERKLKIEEIRGITDPTAAAPFRNSYPPKDKTNAYRPIADGTSPDILLRLPKDSEMSSNPIHKRIQSHGITPQESKFIDTPKNIDLSHLNPSMNLSNLKAVQWKEMQLLKTELRGKSYDPKDLAEFTTNQVEIKSVGKDFFDDILHLKKTLQDIYLEAVFQLRRGGIHKQLRIRHEVVQAQQNALFEKMETEMKPYQDFIFWLSVYTSADRIQSLFQLLFYGDNPTKSPYYQQIQKRLSQINSDKRSFDPFPRLTLLEHQKSKAMILKLNNKESKPLSRTP